MAAVPLAAQAPTTTSQPLTLDRLLGAVLERHPLVQAARARVRAAEGARATAGAFGNPVLGYQVDNTPFPGNRSLPPGLDREAMATATLPLEALYQRAPRVRGADAGIRAAAADAVAERQHVALEAVHAYYRAALAQVSLATAQDLAGWLDTVVAYDRTRVREGATAEADLIRSELERDRAAADATMQEADLARALADLAAFVGDSVATERLTIAVDEAPLAMASPTLPMGATTSAAVTERASQDAPLETAFANRAELRAARERLSAASAGVATGRGMLLRQLGLTLGAKQTIGTTSLIAGVSFPLPLFDQNRGEVARASAVRDEASFELAAQRRTIRGEVVGDAEAARLLTERAMLLSRRGSDGFLGRADQARRIALGAYREGAVPLLQVLDAARAWGDSRGVYYRTLFAQHESVIALLAAEGIDLFTHLPAATPAPKSTGRTP